MTGDTGTTGVDAQGLTATDGADDATSGWETDPARFLMQLETARISQRRAFEGALGTPFTLSPSWSTADPGLPAADDGGPDAPPPRKFPDEVLFEPQAPGGPDPGSGQAPGPSPG